VIEATKKLRNGRAVGPDGMPGELLKYGSTELHMQMAQIFNEMFEKGEDLELGQGTLSGVARFFFKYAKNKKKPKI
jgi:hypothetical protein